MLFTIADKDNYFKIILRAPERLRHEKIEKLR